jgi:capsular exopolysaccharide synthesis family protein
LAQYDLELRDYFRILRKRKFIVISVTILITVFTFIFAKIQTPSPLYKATSSVKVERISNIAGLFIDMISYSSGDNLATQTVIIKSYPVMVRVAKKLGLIAKNLSSEEIRKSQKLLGIISRLQNSINTEQEGDTNIINITATSDDPFQAQLLANTVAEAYRDESIYEKNKRAIDTTKFIENQLKNVEKRLREAEERLKNFKEEANLISLDSQTKSSLNILAATESDLEKVRKDKENFKIQLEQINRDISANKATPLKLFIDDRDSPIYKMNSELTDLIINRDKLLLDYTEKHPLILKIDDNIKSIQRGMIREIKTKLSSLDNEEKLLLNRIKSLREMNKSVPENALKLARLEREVKVAEDLYSMLKQKHQEALIQKAGLIEEVTIVKPALPSGVTKGPYGYSKFILIGLSVGVILGIISAFIIETFDTSIGTIEEVESFLGLPVLGIIPFIEIHEIKEKLSKEGRLKEESLELYSNLISHFDPKSYMAEAFRTFRTNLLFLLTEKKGKSFVITSSSPLEGKTTVVTNLAITMAQLGKKVLLVEGDLRKPRIYSLFGLDREPGLSDLLLGTHKFDEVNRGVLDIIMGKFDLDDVVVTPGLDNLNIITSGTLPPNPSELLNSSKMVDFINEVKDKFDIVLFDTPPLLLVTDAAILASKVDGTILIYEVGKVARMVLKRAKLHLENVKANILGIVLNSLKLEVSPEYFKYAFQHYYGEKKKGLRKTLIDKYLRKYIKRDISLGLKDIIKGFILFISTIIIIIGILWQMEFI